MLVAGHSPHPFPPLILCALSRSQLRRQFCTVMASASSASFIVVPYATQSYECRRDRFLPLPPSTPPSSCIVGHHRMLHSFFTWTGVRRLVVPPHRLRSSPLGRSFPSTPFESPPGNCVHKPTYLMISVRNSACMWKEERRNRHLSWIFLSQRKSTSIAWASNSLLLEATKVLGAVENLLNKVARLFEASCC